MSCYFLNAININRKMGKYIVNPAYFLRSDGNRVAAKCSDNLK